MDSLHNTFLLKPSAEVVLQPSGDAPRENTFHWQQQKDPAGPIYLSPCSDWVSLDFVESAQTLFQWMFYHTRPHHIQININKTLCQVFIRLHGNGMVAIFPESTFSFLALIILLPSPAGDELHALRNHILLSIHHQQINVGRVSQYS